jgi:hypothetical protein
MYSEPFQNDQVAEVFAAYTKVPKQNLLRLRQLIFATAAKIKAVGPIKKILKWRTNKNWAYLDAN